MNKVIVDPSIRSKLRGLTEHLQLCDETGSSLGHFLPDDLFRELLVSSAEFEVSESELERRDHEPGGRTLPEIWKRLGRT